MVIAIDGAPLTVATGGIRRYTEELALALAVEYPRDEVCVLSDQPFSWVGEEPANLHVMPALGAGFVSRRWWAIGANLSMRRIGADVFHGTDFAVPYLPLRPAVMTVHDLSPWLDPTWHPGPSVVRRRTPAMIRLGSATLFITPTERVRAELTAHLGVHPSRIVVVPEAPSERVCPGPPLTPGPPYLLSVGTVEPRKNISLAVDTWRRVRQDLGLRLLIAGRERGDEPLPSPEPGLELLGPVSDEVLGSLYAGATAVLYPSSYEGFGLPVLEAMRCGALVMTGPDPALHEVAAGAVIRVASLDGEAWASSLRRILDHPPMACLLRTLAARRAAEFSWRRTAIETREVYAEAIRRF